MIKHAILLKMQQQGRISFFNQHVYVEMLTVNAVSNLCYLINDITFKSEDNNH